MAFTNQTPNYGLPQWIGTDKPTYLSDQNGAYLTIDTQLKSIEIEATDAKGIASAAQGAANTALSTSQSNSSAIVTINNTITTVQSNQTTLENTVNTVQSNQTALEDALKSYVDMTGITKPLSFTDQIGRIQYNKKLNLVAVNYMMSGGSAAVTQGMKILSFPAGVFPDITSNYIPCVAIENSTNATFLWPVQLKSDGIYWNGANKTYDRIEMSGTLFVQLLP